MAGHCVVTQTQPPILFLLVSVNAMHRQNPHATASRLHSLGKGACLLVVSGLLSGCAALTNPVANGVPVRMLPEELLSESREGFEQIPLTTLRQPPPKEYLLAPGDTLGIYVEGVLGSAEVPPPVNVPATPEEPPSIGYPFPIRQDGTVSLPFVGALEVEGLTLEQAEKQVIDAYLDQDILREEDNRILVTLLRPRYFRIMVIREDTSGGVVQIRTESLPGLSSTSTIGGQQPRAEGQVLELAAYENDVLNALTRTGGMPAYNSVEEVVIQRGYWDGDPSVQPLECQMGCPPGVPCSGHDEFLPDGRRRVVRIPLRRRCDDPRPLPFRPEDVVLGRGDIVTVRVKQPEFYFTAGLIPASEVLLPQDRDLRVVEAILRARGPLLNGGINTNNFIGSTVAAGIGYPSPSLLSVLRKTEGGGQVTITVDLDEAVRDPRENILVQSGDVLVLQEKPDQAVARYFTSTLGLDFVGRWLNRGDATGTATGRFP